MLQEQWALGNTDAYKMARAERWLNDRIKRGMHEKFSEFTKLTLELAQLLLQRNDDNRPPNRRYIDKLVRDILGGHYHITGETMVISKEGLMNDGQHRCYAVVEAGRPIEVNMVFGVERDARMYMDQGTQRTAGNYLSMTGVRDANNIAAAARKILEINRNGKLFTSPSPKEPTKTEAVEFAHEILGELEYACRMCRRKGHGRIAALSTLIAVHYLFSQKDRADADHFMERLIKGAGLKERDPIFVAREKLTDPTKRLTQNEQFKTLIMAWNNFRAYRTVRSLTHTLKKGEKLPEIR